jgi:putative iron-only hydrogenase system regulator
MICGKTGRQLTPLSRDGGKEVNLEKSYHSVTIIVYDRESAYNQVSKLIHDYSPYIQARLGYPVPGENVAIIYLILKMTTDALGALSGKLGQLPQVNVKASTLKINQE